MKQLIVLLCLSAISLSGWSQFDRKALKSKYLQEFQELMKKQDIQGLSFALVSADSLLMDFNLGHSDENLTEKVTSKTLFGLGSVTKVFTGLSVMQLAETGRVKLDEPLTQYLPQFDIRGEHREKVTVRNVMAHHAGLPSDIIKGMFTQKPESYERVVEYMNHEYMAMKPEQIRAYSNPAYSLLGHMVQEVSGKKYPEYVRDEILSKIGMHKSGFNLRDAASATFNAKGKPEKEVLLRDLPAGGMYSNSEEMISFLQAYLRQDERLLSEVGYNQIFKEQYTDLPLNFEHRYALGWNISSRPHAGKIFRHTGTMLYFNAAIAVAPQVGLAAVVLNNSKGGGSTFNTILSAIDDAAKEMGFPEQKDDKIQSFKKSDKIELPDSVTERYVSLYGAPGALMKVYKKRDRLFMRMRGLKVRLIPVDSNVFIPKILLMGFIPIKLNEVRFSFENIAGYEVITQSEIGSGKELLATKIDPYKIGNSWKKRMGKYRVVNKLAGEIDFFTDFELLQKEGLLVMSFSQGEQEIDMPLEIINDSRANISGIGRYAGQSLHTNDRQHLSFFGLELQQIK